MSIVIAHDLQPHLAAKGLLRQSGPVDNLISIILGIGRGALLPSIHLIIQIHKRQRGHILRQRRDGQPHLRRQQQHAQYEREGAPQAASRLFHHDSILLHPGLLEGPPPPYA